MVRLMMIPRNSQPRKLTQDINNWSSVAAQSVPEPTSGLLLLLGMAGLALKRKRA